MMQTYHVPMRKQFFDALLVLTYMHFQQLPVVPELKQAIIDHFQLIVDHSPNKYKSIDHLIYSYGMPKDTIQRIEEAENLNKFIIQICDIFQIPISEHYNNYILKQPKEPSWYKWHKMIPGDAAALRMAKEQAEKEKKS
jgi:hypothetical protein